MLITLHNRLAAGIERLCTPHLPTAARLVFAGVLLMYFWASGMTKLGPGPLGLFSPSLGAYAQIFPRAMEAAGYDPSQLGLMHRLVIIAGTAAEFILPALIVIGLFTRLAALGMIGFVLVQSVTDVVGHGAASGAWFDRAADALIADQRAFWILALALLVARGAGPLSADRLLRVT